MAIYVIADLHLSTGEATDKSMEIFGPRWDRYVERLISAWQSSVCDGDTVVIPGDISWAMSLPEAKADLSLIDSLPGKKLLGKGNHDFWWGTVKKMEAAFSEYGFNTLSFLYNNAYFIDGVLLCGTRGWYHDPSSGSIPSGTDYAKLIHRECERLRLSIAAMNALRARIPEAKDAPAVAFLHFPPVWGETVCRPIVDVLHEGGIRRVCYGHIHGVTEPPAPTVYEGISLSLVSADYLGFSPQKLTFNENSM